MQKYGTIDNGKLIISDRQLDGYKPVSYSPVPQFDQTTQYVYEGTPVDNGDTISVPLLVGTATQSDPIDQNGPM